MNFLLGLVGFSNSGKPFTTISPIKTSYTVSDFRKYSLNALDLIRQPTKYGGINDLYAVIDMADYISLRYLTLARVESLRTELGLPTFVTTVSSTTDPSVELLAKVGEIAVNLNNKQFYTDSVFTFNHGYYLNVGDLNVVAAS